MKWRHPKHTILTSLSICMLGGLLAYANCGSKTGSGGGSYNNPAPFVSTWQTTTANETITLPLREGFEYNMKVDWGDGSPRQEITAWDDADKAHEYADAGTYTITLRGTAETWYFNACGMTPDTGSENNLLTVEELGDMGWKSFENAFCGCENLTTFKGGVTSKVTNMAWMFSGAYNVELDIPDWDTSKVTNMSHMFESNVEGLDISQWDTSSVTDMSNMFAGIGYALDLRSLDTQNVTNMEGMFIAASASPDIRGWNTSKVTNMRQMFYLSAVNPNMSEWNFAKVENMNQILTGSQVSTRNYTDLLKRIFETRTVNDVDLGATSQYYDSAASARASLVNNHSWNITDNGSAGPDPG